MGRERVAESWREHTNARHSRMAPAPAFQEPERYLERAFTGVLA